MHTRVKQLEDECIALEREGEELEHDIQRIVETEEAEREKRNKDHKEWVRLSFNYTFGYFIHLIAIIYVIWYRKHKSNASYKNLELRLTRYCQPHAKNITSILN